jgi:hypothetical protein
VNAVDWTRTSGRVVVDVDDVDDEVVLELLDVVAPGDVDVELDVELEVDVDELVELVVPGTLVEVDELVDDVVATIDVEVDELVLVELEVLDDVDVLLDVLDVVLGDVELDELVLLDVDELVLVLDEVLLDVDGMVDDEVVVDGMVDDEVVVVGDPHGPVCGDTLAAFAGSVPQSSSRRSYVPSRSRSTPIRVPEPSGTHVYVSSCPAVAAWFLRFVFVITPSVFRSGWKLLLPT